MAISLAQVLNRVALPYYARALDDATRLITFASVAPLSAALAILAAAPVIVMAPEIRDLLLGSSASAAPLAILAAYGIVRAFGVAIGTALNGSGAARLVTLTAALNTGLIALLVVPGYQVAGPSGVAAVVLGSLALSIAPLIVAAHRLGATLSFLTPAAVGGTLLVLLVIGPQGAAPLVVRIAAGATSTILATWWAWQILGSDGLTIRSTTSTT